ncbi:MAG: hypothetical protein HOD72_09255 [Opitutae bacterium]|jgi:hypothetical protein|nr:hypothetical protein [Opitutae bacterium]MBT4224635.1 hypothetical protein [Opitutae bacterium]MBT5379739.1 hypothetical protein [Opitutae bacterium]MBT5692627.1 hypothetical protein [Opitutae bacterium]MBT6461248.1 hypothetical protein [Opitutae bacterium]
MAIYEFYSPDTNKIYRFFAKTLAQKDTIPKCPDGDQFTMKKMLSSFGITGKTRKSRKDEMGAGMGAGMDDLDDPRVASLMKEMEGAVEGMDEDNPDPRVMGNLMRKMGDAMGETFDPQMEEVVRKLEEGQNPETIEEQMDDFLGDEEGGHGDGMGGMPGMGGMDGPGPDGAEGDEGKPKGRDIRGESRRILRKLRPPVRDPKLYEYD